MNARLLVAVALALLLAAGARAEDVFLARAVGVNAGNELRVMLDGWRMTVRLHGVLPPEAPAYARLAREYLRRRTEGTRVRVEVVGTAARGIVYGNVYPADTDDSLNREILTQGLGTWADQYAPDRTDLRMFQNYARNTGAGLWANRDGENVTLPPMAASSRKLPAAKATPTPPRPTPPSKRSAAAPRSRRIPVGALKVGLLALGAALLGGAARCAEPVRRAHRRSQPLAGAKSGFVRASGIGRPVVGVVASTVGKVPGLYIRERTWRFTGRNWRLERDEADGVSFLLDDGTAVAVVAADGASFFPFRVARFYNEVPVERWYDRAYPSDTRTEIHYLPAEAPVTVLGRYLSDDATFEASSAWGNVAIVEGDPRRIVRGAAALALGLGIASLAAFVGAVVLSPR